MGLYSLRGYFLHSEFALPSLALLPEGSADAEMTLRIGSVPAPMGEGIRGRVTHEVTEERITTSIHGLLRVAIKAGHEVTLQLHPACPAAEAARRIPRAIFGPLLLQRRGLVVHASAVSFGRSAAVFTAASGTGKSTLALSLVRRGHAYIADDRCGLDFEHGGFHVLPWEKGSNLLLDTVKQMGLIDQAVPRCSFKMRIPQTLDPYLRPRVGAIFLLRRFDQAEFILERLKLDEAEPLVRRSIPVISKGLGRDLALAVREDALERLLAIPCYDLAIPNGWRNYDALLDSVEAVMAATNE